MALIVRLHHSLPLVFLIMTKAGRYEQADLYHA